MSRTWRPRNGPGTRTKSAGRDSDTLPGAKWLFLPMRTGRGAMGIVGITRDGPDTLLGAGQRPLLDALVNQGALAIERVHLVEDIDRVDRLAETDRLRTALLTSISHDLRTPLAAILGSAGAIRELGKSLDDDAKADLLATIIEESERLNRFIANLLDMTRLEFGCDRPESRAARSRGDRRDGFATRRKNSLAAPGHRQPCTRSPHGERRRRAVRAGLVQHPR